MEDLMPVDQFCIYHQVEQTFLYSLREYGLLEIITVDESEFIALGQLQQLEKLTRLHYDLDINVAGIEAIAHLLERVEMLQAEMTALKNRLRLYEDV